jgi:hypothetical protein
MAKLIAALLLDQENGKDIPTGLLDKLYSQFNVFLATNHDSDMFREQIKGEMIRQRL